MPLSEYEQRVLEQMERALTSDDPRLATTMRSSERRSGLRWLAAGAGVVVGLLLLVVGVMLSPDVVGIVIGVAGFALMFAGVLFALSRPKTPKGPQGVVKDDGGTQPRPAPQAPVKRSGFLERLEERWDRRRGEDGR
ncbi:hypothetical protein GCM10025865_31510 [Paraoerskovia sediminicola]|uniref:DUF3040 domain-containing protein n=1 Tax=Paraoerskovia sediminicola TaxID=1138587 RepID=A0ABM8G6S3_9CELL|nr:DUF3040 domain-containing protein [Paraoerskovia sediminicola]BDZ43852.1 hypothetical protein GCM10025865_31510 [Paraoerskovia sediminicola]